MSFDITMETTNLFKEIKFQWKIKNFSKSTDRVEGPPFFPISEQPFCWKVVLKLGESHGITVFLNSLDEEEAAPPLKVVGKFSFKNSEGTLWKQNPFDRIIKAGKNVQCWNLKKADYALGSLRNLITLIDDIFVVECSMTVSGVISSLVSPASVVPAVRKEDEDVCNALKGMYKNNAFTDVTFNIGKQTIRSHKAVLSARSSVFEEMFEHDILEKQNSSIDIQNYDYHIFESFIGYIYTKKIRIDLKEDLTSLLRLYQVANEYKVFDLRRYCADIFLSSFLNDDSFYWVHKLADMHNDSYMKKSAIGFICHKILEGEVQIGSV